MNLNSLPPELITQVIAPHLEINDLVSLSQTCHKMKETVANLLPVFSESIFLEKFGTPEPSLQGDLAALKERFTRINMALKITEKLGIEELVREEEEIWEDKTLGVDKQSRSYNIEDQIFFLLEQHPHLLDFDDKGRPILIDFQSSSFKGIKKRYDFFRGKYQIKIKQQCNQIFDQYLQDFPDGLSHTNDEARRLETIRDEYAQLQWALRSSMHAHHKFIKEMPYWEKLAFRIVFSLSSFLSGPIAYLYALKDVFPSRKADGLSFSCKILPLDEAELAFSRRRGL